MPSPWIGAACILASYLVGSICAGIVLARRRGIDLRAIGSGNVGATNVRRALGSDSANLVLVFDVAKGLVAVLVTRLVTDDSDLRIVAATGLAACVGHVLPVWHGFRGGKGVATALGVLLATSPGSALAAGVVYAVAHRLTHKASIGSLSGVTVAALSATAIHGAAHPFAWLAWALWVLVMVTHRSNLTRLLDHEELDG
ncbi:MAG: glycerol-3-phosphate 1-O-acyltransferase PlsY [Polyangiales bacterium]|nr:glycerol-3-phosphate 1-O-acyltransferase PlsY [Myxococcales bacterium]